MNPSAEDPSSWIGALPPWAQFLAILLTGGFLGWYMFFRDKLVKILRQRIDQLEQLLSTYNSKIDELEKKWEHTREENHRLRAELHAAELKLVEMRERTDFEPVRDLLATLVHSSAASSTQLSSLNQNMERMLVAMEMARNDARKSSGKGIDSGI